MSAIKRIAIIILCILIAFPLLYAFSMSFFSPSDFTDSYAHFLPGKLGFSNYRKAFSTRLFGRYILNSALTSVLSMALRVAVSVSASFAFSHLAFRGRKALLIILLSTLFIPQDANLYQNYTTIARLSLLDTYLGIILPGIFSASAMLLMVSSCAMLDKDIYAAAQIDGSGDIRYIASILVHMIKPTLITVALQAFIGSFNSYLWPLLVTNKPRMRTIQIALTMLGFAEEGAYGAQFASIMVITLPFVALIAAGRKQIMKSLSETRMH